MAAIRTRWTLVVLCGLVVLGGAGASQAQCCTYSIVGGGGQGQIGDGLPIPIQLATTRNLGTGAGMSPIGTGTKFPGDIMSKANPSQGVGSLGVDPNLGATLKQEPFTAMGKLKPAGAQLTLEVKPGAFRRIPPGYLVLGVVPNNPRVFQVRTNLSFTGPGPFFGNSSDTMGAMVGGRTSSTPNVVMAGSSTTTFMGVPSSATVTYRATSNRFGGPSQTRVVKKSDVWVWVNGLAVKPPCMALSFGGSATDPNDSGCFGPLLIANPRTKVVAGGPVGTFATTTPPFAMSPGIAQLSITKANGTIKASKSVAMTASVRNTAQSAGFPWTVGMLTIMQPNALIDPETFMITGMDNRNRWGGGTISLVAGALSDRNLSGPNANRSWARYVLAPEPGAVVGAGVALAVLGLCHALVRNRRR